MNKCKVCNELQLLINKGSVVNAVCHICMNDDFDYTPSKTAPNKKKITQKHWDALYNKYHEAWGIDVTIKWLDKKFDIVD